MNKSLIAGMLIIANVAQAVAGPIESVPVTQTTGAGIVVPLTVGFGGDFSGSSRGAYFGNMLGSRSGAQFKQRQLASPAPSASAATPPNGRGMIGERIEKQPSPTRSAGEVPAAQPRGGEGERIISGEAVSEIQEALSSLDTSDASPADVHSAGTKSMAALTRERWRPSGLFAGLKAASNRMSEPKGRLIPGVRLGRLEKPGKALAGRTFKLKSGEGLFFSAQANQIQGLGDVKINGKSADRSSLSYQHILEDQWDGRLGSKAVHDYGFIAGKDAKPGLYKVEFSGMFQSRNDAAWHFTFTVEVVGRRPAAAAGAWRTTALPKDANLIAGMSSLFTGLAAGIFTAPYMTISQALVSGLTATVLGGASTMSMPVPRRWPTLLKAAGWTAVSGAGAGFMFNAWHIAPKAGPVVANVLSVGLLSTGVAYAAWLFFPVLKDLYLEGRELVRQGTFLKSALKFGLFVLGMCAPVIAVLLLGGAIAANAAVAPVVAAPVVAAAAGKGFAALFVHAMTGLGMGTVVGFVVGAIIYGFEYLQYKKRHEEAWMDLLGWMIWLPWMLGGSVLGAVGGVIYHFVR